jgi:PAS domain S-box-containing protein
MWPTQSIYAYLFIPHGISYQWNSFLIWLHAGSDLLIATAYFSISITLLRLVRRRRSIPFGWMFVCFGVFIAACGTTHLLGVLTLWVPAYWLSGTVKLVTAAASLLTAALLVRHSPQILKLPTPEEMRAANSAVKRQAEILRVSEERFRHMAENMQEIFWELDPRTLEAIYVSPAFEKICERPLDSLRLDPTSYRTLIHPDDAERVLRALSELVAASPMEEEFRIVCPSGAIKWVFVHGSTAKNADGQVVALVGTTIDIGARKKMEEVLREREDRYRDLVEHSHDLICIHDMKGRLLSINERQAKVLGYSRDEILNTPISEFIAPEARAEFDEYLSRISATGVAAGLMCVVTKNGERRIWEYHNTLRTEGVIEPIVRGVAHDVTEQKHAEKALRLSEEKFSKAFMSIPIDVAITTLDGGEFVDVNEAFEKQTGLSRSEIIGKSVLDLEGWVDPGQRSSLVDEIKAGGRIRSREVQCLTKSGTVQTKLYSAETIEIGGKQCLLVACEDITQRKIVEEALMQSEANYRSLFLSSPCGIYRVTLDGTFMFVNDALVEMLGYDSADELLSKKAEKNVYANPDERYRILETMRQLNPLESVEVHWKRKDGTLILVRAHTRAVTNEYGQVTCLENIVEDITQQRILEEQLRQVQKMESLALLAGGIAHDFNNILTGVLGYGQLVLKTLNRPRAEGQSSILNARSESDAQILGKTKSQVQHMVDAAIHGKSLTGQLLAFSRDEALPIYPFNPDVEIKKLEEMIRRLIGEHIHVLVHLECEPQKVLGERGAFVQIILNLCVNARDAMPKGGQLVVRTFAVNVELACEEHVGIPCGSYVVLEVADTGCGMDRTVQERIFEPFFTTKPMGRGTGLGLYTVYAILRRCGGHIRVQSELRHGSTFWLYFPVVDVSRIKCQAAPDGRIGDLGDGLVMVVEDDARVREMVTSHLENFGFQVLCEASPTAAIHDYERLNEDIKLLVTDVVMPELSGPDLAGKLKERQPNLRILYMTGWAPADILPAGALGQGVELLRKPFDEYELNSTIRHLFAS